MSTQILPPQADIGLNLEVEPCRIASDVGFREGLAPFEAGVNILTAHAKEMIGSVRAIWGRLAVVSSVAVTGIIPAAGSEVAADPVKEAVTVVTEGSYGYVGDQTTSFVLAERSGIPKIVAKKSDERFPGYSVFSANYVSKNGQRQRVTIGIPRKTECYEGINKYERPVKKGKFSFGSSIDTVPFVQVEGVEGGYWPNDATYIKATFLPRTVDANGDRPAPANKFVSPNIKPLEIEAFPKIESKYRANDFLPYSREEYLPLQGDVARKPGVFWTSINYLQGKQVRIDSKQPDANAVRMRFLMLDANERPTVEVITTSTKVRCISE